VAATSLEDRIGKDLIGRGDGSQHVRKVRGQLGMVAEDLVPPQLAPKNDARPGGVLGLSNQIACHRRRLSDRLGKVLAEMQIPSYGNDRLTDSPPTTPTDTFCRHGQRRDCAAVD
jgi:hypothetical protein